jgi:hypothetical protein
MSDMQAGTGKAEIPGGIPCPERWRYLHEYGAGTATHVGGYHD